MTSNHSQVAMTTCGTTVLWGCCLTVGLTGMVLPHQLPLPPRIDPLPIAATMLDVTIGDVQAAPTEEQSNPQQPAAINIPSPISAIAAPSTAPPMLAIAAEHARVVSVVPTTIAGLVVPSAATATLESTDSAAGPAVQHLVYEVRDSNQRRSIREKLRLRVSRER